MKDYDRGESHLEEIDHVSILESIDEIFDGASSLMTPNSVMYGSSVTSVIAGLPIVGDLDIAVANQEFMTLCQNFATSVKWIQVDGKTIPERNPHPRLKSKNSPPSWHPSSGPMQRNKYANAKHLPISNVVGFKAVNDARVQIVESKTMTGDLLEDALGVVRKVDLTFCGIAVDRYGRMLEVIPHAYDDCCNRIIRIQDYQPRLDVARLKHRMLKYIRRGWHLSLSIDQAVLNLKKAQKEYHLSKKKPNKKKKRIKNAPGFEIKQTVGRGYIIVASRTLTRMVGSKGHVRDVVRHFAYKEFNLSLDACTGKNDSVEFYVKGNKEAMTTALARELTYLALNHLEENGKLDIDRLRYEIKKEDSKYLYKMDKASSSYHVYTGTNSSSSGWHTS